MKVPRTLLRGVAVANSMAVAGALIAWRAGILPAPAGFEPAREVQELMGGSKSYSFHGLSACGPAVDPSATTMEWHAGVREDLTATTMDWSVSTPTQAPLAVFPLPTVPLAVRHHRNDLLNNPGLVFFTSKAYFSEPLDGAYLGPRARDLLTTEDWSAATPPQYSPSFVSLPDQGFPFMMSIRRIPIVSLIDQAVCP